MLRDRIGSRSAQFTRRVVAISAALVGLNGTHAQAATSEDGSPSWWGGDTASGTWGGARTRLEREGLKLEPAYTAEAFTWATGPGRPPPASYRGNVDFGLTLDLGKLGLWQNGTLYLLAQNGHGSDISARVGTDMAISNLEAPSFTQLSEAWFAQQILDGLMLRSGKQDANRDFAAPRFPGNFIHSSFGAMPTIPMPSFPAPGLGIAVLSTPASWLDVRAGMYEGVPAVERYATIQHGGFFSIGELIARHGLGSTNPDAFQYTVGGWYHSEAGAYLQSYGVFAVADALLPVINKDKQNSSFGVFVRAGWSPPDQNAATLFVGGGLTYHPVRVTDTVGLGGGQLRASKLAPAGGHTESYLELFYKMRVTHWWTVQPDFQLVFHPGGQDTTAVAVGLRLKLKM